MSSVRRVIMSSISNALSFKHGLSLWCPQSTSVNQISQPCSVSSKIFRRRFSVLASSFANENREFVIVGGGNASGYAARTFLEHGMADGKLCIVSKEAYVPYERPALTKAYLFPLDKKPARLPGFHTCVGAGGERQTPDWYKEKGIEMLHEDPVADIDTEKQTLTTNSGKLLKYGSLIIATGCTASRFPDKIGGNLPGVHYVRDVADANSLISSLEKSKKVVVVGGGYIGMEVAAATVAWKLDTTIIFPEDHLMTRLFTPSLAQKYEDLYKDYGVNFVKGASIKSLEAGSDGRVSGVKLENGSIIEADTVVIGIGGKPAVGPFESVGLNKTVGGIQNMRDVQFFQDRAILAPTNEMVEKINDYVMSLLLDEKVVYMSSDNICITVNGDVEEHEEIFFIELLNQTKCFGLPNHIIKLKVECIVMLLRNIDQSRELYNGTRLIVTKLTTRVIEAQIISSKNVGQNVLIGRMVLSPYDTTKFSVMFQRKQFPLAVCYAMIINKSQRQSLSHVGLYLSSDVFSHGQLSMYLSSDVFSHGQLSRRD